MELREEIKLRKKKRRFTLFKTIVKNEIVDDFLCGSKQQQQQQQRSRAKETTKPKGRVCSRNNVTQLKIPYADVVVYQMEIHTRISLSIHHNGIYGSREYAK